MAHPAISERVNRERTEHHGRNHGERTVQRSRM